MVNYKIFGEINDGKTLAQMNSAMCCPFVVEGALMPDAHAGYALPIGAVVKTKDVVVPAWVGYDIGCGMSGTKLFVNNEMLTTENLEKIKQAILATIPMGNNSHKKSPPKLPKGFTEGLSKTANHILQTRASGQLGTLGGGNHFIELNLDSENFLWIVIHSGSRGFGHGLATHYMKEAAMINGVDKGNLENHYGINSSYPVFDEYINDALAAQAWALLNRKIMSTWIMNIIESFIGDVEECDFINRNHNHVDVLPNNEYIHRNGATHAEEGMFGIIPGNMRDGSFVVVGKGNPDSLNSSSHGAGRVLSRSEAKKMLSVDKFKDMMSGIVTNISDSLIDESPEAYKNIFEVMQSQKELVTIVTHLKPILNVKG